MREPTLADKLIEAETELGLGPVALSRAMGVPYDTLKNWRSGRRPMPPVAVRCLELLVAHPGAAKRLARKVA